MEPFPLVLSLPMILPWMLMTCRMSVWETHLCLSKIWLLCWENESPDFQLIPSVCTRPSVSPCNIVLDLQWYLFTKLFSEELHFSAVSGFPAAEASTSPSLLGWTICVCTTFQENLLTMPSSWAGCVGLGNPFRHLAVGRASDIRVNLAPNSSFCVAALLLAYRAPLWAPGLCSESVPKCFYSHARYTLWALGGLSAEHPWFLFPIDESHTTGLNVALAVAPPSSTLHTSFV